MTIKTTPTPETLRGLLRYKPETGGLFWRARPVGAFSDGKHTAEHRAAIWNSRYADTEAFTSIDARGYRQGKVFDRLFRGHRVAWALFHGEWPDQQVDHIDGDRTNNRIKNLRLVSNAENSRNQRMRSNNTSGVVGVRQVSRTGRWHAYIKVDGHQIHLGCFVRKADACRARKSAESEFGFHENHGNAKKIVQLEKRWNRDV